MRLVRFILSSLLVGASFGAAAANLSEIFLVARDNDAQYAGARQAYLAGIEKRAQALALTRPSVNLSANVRANRDWASDTDIESAYGSDSATLSLTQPLWRPENLQTLAQGELQVQLAAEQLRQAEQDLLLRVGKAYFDVVQAQDVLASIGAQKDAFAQQLAQARRSREVGTAAITDVNDAQTKYDLTLAQEIAGRNDLEVKGRALERIINREAPPLARYDEMRRIALGAPGELAALLERAPQEGLVVSVARLTRDIARHEVLKQDLAGAPTADLTMQYNRSKNVVTPGTLTRNTTTQSTIGLEFSWPLYQGGGIASRQREAVANLGKAEADLDNARRQAAFDARQAYLSVLSGAAQVTALEQALDSGESQVRSTRRGLEVGVRTRLDVLNAEQQVYVTRRDLAAARYQTMLALLQLRSAANALSERDLRELDALLKP
jgi:outer membrane protein